MAITESGSGSVEPRRIFQELDILGHGQGRSGITLGATDKKTTGLFNTILKKLGHGQIEVDVNGIKSVNVSSARKYVARHKNLLVAMGIVGRDEKSFSPSRIREIVQNIHAKNTQLSPDDRTYLKTYGLLLNIPELVAYLKKLKPLQPTTDNPKEIVAWMEKILFTEEEKRSFSIPHIPSDNEQLRKSLELFRTLIEYRFFTEIKDKIQVKDLVWLELPDFPRGATPTQVPSSDKVHLWLREVSAIIDANLASLPRSLRKDFDREKLLQLNGNEVKDLNMVMDYWKNRKNRLLEASFKSGPFDKNVPPPKNTRTDIINFMMSLGENDISDGED